MQANTRSATLNKKEGSKKTIAMLQQYSVYTKDMLSPKKPSLKKMKSLKTKPKKRVKSFSTDKSPVQKYRNPNGFISQHEIINNFNFIFKELDRLDFKLDKLISKLDKLGSKIDKLTSAVEFLAILVLINIALQKTDHIPSKAIAIQMVKGFFKKIKTKRVKKQSKKSSSKTVSKSKKTSSSKYKSHLNNKSQKNDTFADRGQSVALNLARNKRTKNVKRGIKCDLKPLKEKRRAQYDEEDYILEELECWSIIIQTIHNN